jgi:hypothetical protein
MVYLFLDLGNAGYEYGGLLNLTVLILIFPSNGILLLPVVDISADPSSSFKDRAEKPSHQSITFFYRRRRRLAGEAIQLPSVDSGWRNTKPVTNLLHRHVRGKEDRS